MAKKETISKELGRKLYLNLIEETEKQILQDATCRLLWETGIMVECSEAAERFQSAGAKVEKKVDDFLVKIPQWMVMESIASAPSNMPLYGQSPEFDFFPADGEQSLLPFGIHPQIIDPETREVRATTKKDCEDLIRFVRQLPNIRVHLDSLSATDYKENTMVAAQAHAMLSGSPQFIMCANGNVEENKTILKMAHAVAGGEEKFRERPFLTILPSPISPLLLKRGCTTSLTFLAESGLVCMVANMCLAGATGPVSLTGCVVLTLAELLASLVYVQIVRKGAPTLLSTGSSILDMKSGLSASGSPDTGIICSLTAKMLASYGFFGYFSSGVSDAKIPDAQSAYEFCTNVAISAAAGTPIICGAGSLEGGLTFDYAKLLLDNECFNNIMHRLNGVSYSADALALDVMKEVGPGNTYLMHKSTVRGFRNHISQTDLFSRTSREAWTKAGSKSVTEQAYAKALDMLNVEQPPHLNPSVQSEIDGILAEFTKK